MSKRTFGSGSGSPKKRLKLSHGEQPTLQSFFSNPKSGHPSSSKIEDSDPEQAAKLAAEEGLYVKATRMEEAWKLARGQDVIDVDALDDSVNEPPSTTKVANTARKIAMTSELSPKEYGPLDVDPLTFNGTTWFWRDGSDTPYSFLSHALMTLSGTRSRISILAALTNTLTTIIRLNPSSLLPALYLLSNTLSPPYSSVELGIGPSVLSKSIQQVSGLTSSSLKQLYTKHGDIGDVAFEAKCKVKTLVTPKPLLVASVYSTMLRISSTKGQGAAKTKQSLVEKMLIAAKGEEIRFLARTLAQNLRVGAVRTSLLVALARAMVLSPRTPEQEASPRYISRDLQARAAASLFSPKKMTSGDDHSQRQTLQRFADAEAVIGRVFAQHPNYDHLVAALLEFGLDDFATYVGLVVGIPLQPALGSPTRSLEEIYERLEDAPFVAEWKYDGQRAQIHAEKKEDGLISVSLFSRHLEDMTSKYPDAVGLVKILFDRSPTLQSFIMDSEVVAIDSSDGSLRPFQELSKRGKKDVKIGDVKVAVAVFAFDLMYLNKEILIGLPFRRRRTLLKDAFPEFTPENAEIARFAHVDSCGSEGGRDVIQEFWEKAVDSRCEGLMIKLLDDTEVLEDVDDAPKGKRKKKPLPSTYEPDKRTSAWLKLKKDYVNGIGDSLDMIPIGAWHGNGRKAQWWSPILLGLQGPDGIVAVCKCMSGFTDVFYKSLNERYVEGSDTCSSKNLWNCETGQLKPPVYFKPGEVWEVRGADITLSPVSVAGMGLISEARGLSLRFPRFLKIREDKGLEQSSDVEFLANIYRKQQGPQQKGTDGGELLDAYESDGYGEDDNE